VAPDEVATRLEPVYRRIERMIERGEIGGAGLAVSVDCRTLVDWYAGLAGADLPAGPEVLWPLASISKVYTAAAIMALVERGILTLSMPAHRVLPECDRGGLREIRLWHLLAHTSGFIYESPEMEQRLADLTPMDRIADEALESPLVASPGTRFIYSDYAFALAARVAERASGMTLPELVRHYVIEPGDLADTFMPPPVEEYGRVAYVRGVPAEGTDGAMYNSHYARQLAHPAFGTIATTRDLLGFGLLFAPSGERRILSEASVGVMTTDQTGGGLPGYLVDLRLDRPQPWGIGFMLRGGNFDAGFGELASPAAFGHPGASGCELVVDPESGVALAFTSNHHAKGDLDGFLFRLATVTNGVLAALTRR
jgi:CubicO group peptidase (beta-lactamase class C family)